jgi:hypothetical protein
MGEKIRDHVRSNVWGMAAMFVALTGPSSRIRHHIHSGVVSIPGASRSASAPRLLRRAGVVLGLGLVVVLAGLGGSAHAAVAALERVTDSSASDSTANKSVTTDSCPAGKQVTGAGGDIVGGDGQVMLRQVRPNAALTSVTMQAVEDQNGFSGIWSLEAHAICATPPGGLELVSVPSASDSSNKGVSAPCPAGKRLLGTGAELVGGTRQVALNDVIPAAGLGGVTVRALEDEDGTTNNWSVTAHAICSNPVGGRERIADAGDFDSIGDKETGADCPPGKQATGGGGEISGGGGEVVLDEFNPNSGLTSVEVRGVEDEDGTTANWFVRAFAICANSSQRVVTRTPETGYDSEDKGDLAPCPAGKQVTGGGAELTGGLGQVLIDDLIPLKADPDPFSTQVLALGLEDEDGTTANWALSIYAICATPLAGLEVRSVTAGPSTNAFVAAQAFCPPGKSVVGAGAEIEAGAGGGEVLLRDIEPNEALTTVTASAIEDETGLVTEWTLTAHAVCANPPPGLELVTTTAEFDSDPSSVTATCPAGKNLLGAAAEIASFNVGQVVIDDIRPNALLTSVTVTGLEDQTGTTFIWAPRAHAICANA